MGIFSANQKDSVQNAAARGRLSRSAQRAQAQDARRRGDNPVRLADLRQRGATDSGHSGRPVRTGLLSRFWS